MSAEAVRQQIAGDWTQHSGSWWLKVSADKVKSVAQVMLKNGARFVALACLFEEERVLKIFWNWDIKGTLLSVVITQPLEAPLPSIVDIYPGADWAERETRDYYAVSFDGRNSTLPLMLRDNDKPGILLPVETEGESR